MATRGDVELNAVPIKGAEIGSCYVDAGRCRVTT